MQSKKSKNRRWILRALLPATALVAASAPPAGAQDYVVVDTGQTACYNDFGSTITCPAEGWAFYGQDAQHDGVQPRYTDHGDGTVSDLRTGLMWQQDPGDKMTYAEAAAGAAGFRLAGYDDWRLPTIKELYSLILFSGVDPSGLPGSDTSGLVPFIDTDTFEFEYGDPSAGERIIDSQFISSTEYVYETPEGQQAFGVNFADGRIKGYGTGPLPGQSEGKGFFVLYVRGKSDYGQNDFVNNGDGTITDWATERMWPQSDSGQGMNWEEALAWVAARNAERYLGYDDWRLPDVKELQTIVDYSRSPDTSGSAAIDPIFNTTSIVNEEGTKDYPFYWTGTTHANAFNGRSAAYVAFGRGLGYMNGQWQDVHGAGCQRGDPKVGDPADWPQGNGPQGDAIRIDNYVRLVRTADAERPTAPAAAFTYSPSAPLVGQSVQFTDRTTGDPTSRSWDFDDGMTSSRKNPSHTFTAPGTYAITLTASNAQGSDTIRRDLTVREAGVCNAGGTTLCLNDGRFRVEVAWEDFAGATGSGQAVPLTDDTGYFWFFDDANIELMVKVLDGRPLNGHFWVFYGALTNVEYTITVTDTETGLVNTYYNPSGQFGSEGDTSAFYAS